MTNEIELGEAAPLIEMLLAESDALERDRILFEAIWAAGVSTSLALWRESPDPASPGAPRWVPSCERGGPGELPDRAEIELLAQSPFDAEVLPSCRTWFAGERGSRTALALRGVSGTEEALDRLEALHALGACLEVEPRQREIEPDSLVRRARCGLDAACELARLEHDLRNVVASIRATRDLLDDIGPSIAQTERGRMERTLDREWRRAGEMLLRGTLTPAAPELASSRPAAVVRQVAEVERAAFRRHALELAVVIEPEAEELRVGVADSDLHRIVQNLLANARQALVEAHRCACVPGPHVEVCVARRDRAGERGVELTVEDRGPGLPPVDPAHLFDAGVSIGAHGGCGLGLAVVRELVEQARGSIRAENRAEGGARFTIALSAGSV